MAYHDEATASFQKTADSSFPIPAAGMQAASNLLRLGHPELAEKILKSLEKELTATHSGRRGMSLCFH